MEFHQDTRAVSAPLFALDTVAEQLADVDLTLPDYCPDIEKILKCSLTPKIQSKALSGGQLQVDGVCVVNVLYVESEKKTIRCCEHSLSFSQRFTVRDAGEGNLILTKTKPEYINCRALSPRRLVIHGAFSLYAKVITVGRTELFTPERSGMETLRKKLPLCDLRSNCQEQFTVSEAISVADKPAIEAVLYVKADAAVTDAKAVSGKLMLSGDININLFYLSNLETGETAKLNYLLPFNQIIDCDGIDEDTENIFHIEVMSFDARLKNDILSDKPAIAFDAMLCVSAEGYHSEDTEIIADAYCTSYACAPQLAELKAVGTVCEINSTAMEKLSAKIDGCKISKILDIYADSVTLETSPAEDGMTAKGKISLCILALDDKSVPVFVERAFDYERRLDAAGCNRMLFDNARVASVSYRLAEDGSVDMRCELNISGGAVESESLRVVSGVDVFEDSPIPPADCALTLYYASAGENLWQIAKSHNTGLSLLMAENALDGLILDSDRMLLIPRL